MVRAPEGGMLGAVHWGGTTRRRWRELQQGSSWDWGDSSGDIGDCNTVPSGWALLLTELRHPAWQPI